MELAISLIQKIRKKFPSSSRTYRLTVQPKYLTCPVATGHTDSGKVANNHRSVFVLLQSLYLEACGDNAKLLEFHAQILKDDENNEAILKRQVA